MLLAVALGRAAAAQETREYDLPELEQPPGIAQLVQARLMLADRFIGTSDFGSFDVLSNQPEARLRVHVPLSRSSVLRFQATTRALFQDFDGVSDLFGTGPTTGAPFDTLLSWRLRLQYGQLLPKSWTLFSERERWAAVAQGSFGANYESDSSIADALRGRGGVGIFYRLKDRLEFAVGVSVGNKLLRNRVAVSPFLEFEWRLNHAWRLKNYGLGLQLEYLISKRLRVFTRARLEGTTFRLAERGDDVGKGILRWRQLPVGLGLRWEALPHLRVTGIVGAIAYNELKVKNQDEHTLSKTRADAAPYLTLRFDVH